MKTIIFTVQGEQWRIEYFERKIKDLMAVVGVTEPDEGVML
jgi:hypothetical protein